MIESRLLTRLGGYIGGKWEDRPTGRTFTVINPANGDPLAELPVLGASETERAVAAAAATLAEPLSLEERFDILRRLAALVREEREAIGRIITLENGKPLAEGIGEADYAAGFYQYAADHLDHLRPRNLDARPRNHDWIIHSRPAGVAGLITPWNFPFAMIAKKLAAALAGGAPSVIKPAEKTPLSMIALFSLLEMLGLRPGLVNLVFGDAPAIGRVLCTDPAVRVISFTGSTAVGRILLEQSAPHIKRVALELGGNAPFLVFEDADLDQAARHLVQNKLRAGGQTCVCANRILVHRSVARSFEEKLVALLEPLRTGDGMAEGVTVGPLIDRAGYDKVRRHWQNAIDQGGRSVIGGPRPREAVAPGAHPGGTEVDWGWFFPPTVVREVPKTALCAREETFGPLFALFEFETDEQAITMANDTEYGLASYLFTSDDDRAQKVIARLHYGHVGYNTGSGPTPEAPFGGMQQSGLGREGGIEGLLDFVELQTVARG